MKSIILIFLVTLLTTFSKPQKPVVIEIPKVYIQTMGEVNPNDLELVKTSIKDFYGFDVVVQGNFGPRELFRVEGLNRYQANKILSHSNKINKSLNGKVLILTSYDICTNRKLNGVVYKNWGIFGLAGIGSKSTVISTHRLKINHDDRLIKVTIHELGHTLGLPHCHSDKDCLMNDANGSGKKVDSEKRTMCNKCRTKINLK